MRLLDWSLWSLSFLLWSSSLGEGVVQSNNEQGSSRNNLCSVYDPFKVLPDNNKFQIGGAFPLHDRDCIRLIPETVGEIVAIQWALTHWNQHPDHANAKTGLYAGDTCSRAKEAISQSLRFLDSVGYHDPEECISSTTTNSTPKLIGLVAPKDGASSLALASLLGTAELPVVTYSSPSVDALARLQLPNIISSAPTLAIYVQVLQRLMANLRSNLVAMVDGGDRVEDVRMLLNKLKTVDIHVSDTVEWTMLDSSSSLSRISSVNQLMASDSSIVLSLLNKQQLMNALSIPEIAAMDKLWINIPGDGIGLTMDDHKSILPSSARLQLITLQPRQKFLPQFRDYFLRVLRNNYQSYSLLTAYMQQVFNCTLSHSSSTNRQTQCSELSRETMEQRYSQAPNIEAVIRVSYALTAIAFRLQAHPMFKPFCDRPSANCTALIASLLNTVEHKFGENDPSEFIGESLHLVPDEDGVFITSGLAIEGIEVVGAVDQGDDDQGTKMKISRVLEYETGRSPRLVISKLKTRMRSVCAPYRSYCGQCERVVAVDSEKYFLSIPKEYPLYVMGLFDFHEGPVCQSWRNTDVSLPMAFIHTVWTFRQRFPQMNLLKNVEFGALLVDACSSGRRAIEIVSKAENECFQFESAERNITVVPGSAFGYVSATQGDAHEALRQYFIESEVTLVGVDSSSSSSSSPSESSSTSTSSSASFSTMPSARAQAMALLRLLKKMQWEFVTVVLSEQDGDSLVLFSAFERLATDRGICMGEVVSMNGDRIPKRLLQESSTNATVLFTTARDAAIYLAGLVKNARSRRPVHILAGDAHDFYLHDSANSRFFVGTVSVQPKDVVYSDFRQWLGMTTPLTLPEMWFWRHVEQRWECALSQSSKPRYDGRMCTGDEQLDVNALGRMTKSGYLARGVERLLFAIDAVYRQLCPEQIGVCAEFYANGRGQIVQVLKKIPLEDDIEIYEFGLGKNGKDYGYNLLGNWSASNGLRLHEQYRGFDGHQSIRSVCEPPLCKCFLDASFFTQPIQVSPAVDDDTGSYIRSEPTGGRGEAVAIGQSVR